ncbi:hypothetical protein FA95DRAFT_1578463, partial [Auriscalpium vulgare]
MSLPHQQSLCRLHDNSSRFRMEIVKPAIVSIVVSCERGRLCFVGNQFKAIALNPARVDGGRAMNTVSRTGGGCYDVGMALNQVPRLQHGRQLAQNMRRDIRSAQKFAGPTDCRSMAPGKKRVKAAGKKPDKGTGTDLDSMSAKELEGIAAKARQALKRKKKQQSVEEAEAEAAAAAEDEARSNRRRGGHGVDVNPDPAEDVDAYIEPDPEGFSFAEEEELADDPEADNDEDGGDEDGESERVVEDWNKSDEEPGFSTRGGHETSSEEDEPAPVAKKARTSKVSYPSIIPSTPKRVVNKLPARRLPAKGRAASSPTSLPPSSSAPTTPTRTPTRSDGLHQDFTPFDRKRAVVKATAQWPPTLALLHAANTRFRVKLAVDNAFPDETATVYRDLMVAIDVEKRTGPFGNSLIPKILSKQWFAPKKAEGTGTFAPLFNPPTDNNIALICTAIGGGLDGWKDGVLSSNGVTFTRDTYLAQFNEHLESLQMFRRKKATKYKDT